MLPIIQQLLDMPDLISCKLLSELHNDENLRPQQACILDKLNH